MYNLEQLRMFVETVQCGSFSACARKLGKVQSAISQGIANLEIDLDMPLFDRSTRKPSLTPEGEQLFAYAQAVLRQTQELNSAVEAINRKEESVIRLALDNALMLPELCTILEAFSHQFPATSLDVISLPSPDIGILVAEQRAHIGLMFSDMSFRQDIELGFIGHLPFYGVCNPHHPLAALDIIKVSDLIPHRQLVLKGESTEQDGQPLQISAQIWSANNFQVIIELVKQGVGWAHIPCHLVETLIHQKELCQLALSFDHKPWSPPVDLITGKNQTAGPAQKWLYDQLKGLLDHQ